MLRAVLSLDFAKQLEPAMEQNKVVWRQEHETPLEDLLESSELKNLVEKGQSIVIEAIKERVCPRFHVPSAWQETVYVRQKKKNEFTRRHQDFEFFQERSYVANLKDPAYTWWTPVSVLSDSTSCLRFYIRQEVVTPNLEVGDVVIFHQSVWHDSSSHKSVGCRYSVDGRLFRGSKNLGVRERSK